MIKKIKFFIRINGIPCHTLEDLYNNFYIQDVITLYKKDVLRRWLLANDQNALAEQLKGLSTHNDIELAKSLVTIFDVTCSQENLNDALHYFYFEKEQKILAEQLQQSKEDVAKSLAIHCYSFNNILHDIAEHNTDFHFLCHAAIALVDNYWQLFELNSRYYSDKLVAEAPCILFPLIAMGKFTSQEETDRRLRNVFTSHIKSAVGPDTYSSFFEENWYARLCKANKQNHVQSAKAIYDSSDDFTVPSNFVLVEKSVDSWDDLIQDCHAKVMVFYMQTATARVRSTRTRDEFGLKDVNGVFPIFNGLDYKDVSRAPRMAYLILPNCITDRWASDNNKLKAKKKEGDEILNNEELTFVSAVNIPIINSTVTISKSTSDKLRNMNN